MRSPGKLKQSLIRLVVTASLTVVSACHSSSRPAQALDEANGVSVSNPTSSEGYWTPERMKNAKPMPMPSVPDPSSREGEPGFPQRPVEAQPGEPGSAPGNPAAAPPSRNR